MKRNSKQLRDKKRAAKKAAMSQPGAKSVYARKLRGEYPVNSPYAAGGRWEHLEPVRHHDPAGRRVDHGRHRDET
jgi:hypothetical protein